jgi:hypothetical protein
MAALAAALSGSSEFLWWNFSSTAWACSFGSHEADPSLHAGVARLRRFSPLAQRKNAGKDRYASGP